MVMPKTLHLLISKAINFQPGTPQKSPEQPKTGVKRASLIFRVTFDTF